jgi:hypothetical protein
MILAGKQERWIQVSHRNCFSSHRLIQYYKNHMQVTQNISLWHMSPADCKTHCTIKNLNWLANFAELFAYVVQILMP